MREEVQCWHNDVMACYQSQMFETLIYKHNLITESSKSYTFENNVQKDLKPMRGYFAMKEIDGKKNKYFIAETLYEDLPVRIDSSEEIFFKEGARTKSVIINPTNYAEFRIVPKEEWKTTREFIDALAPFLHSEPMSWTLNKIIAVMGYIGKSFCGISSLSEFGKSSIYIILDSITKKCPVFQPRSVPGVLAQITGDGNMVFDEAHGVAKDIKDIMENFSLQVAGNSPIYNNGAMAAKNTKPRYDVAQQSITYLFNVYSNYRDPESSFWNYIWKNRRAMESRFLCMEFKGKLLEEFDRKFNIPQVAEDNKMFYVRMAKHLLWLKEQKQQNLIQRKYKPNEALFLKGRHKIIYDEITWGIDQYCSSQEEYDEMIILFNKAINDYREMIGYNKSTW